MMGVKGGGVRIWGRVAAAALALALAACAGPSATVYDLAAARPAKARPVRAQIRIGPPFATADLDSDRILVRNGLTLALLPGGRWPQQLTTLFAARLAETFQNAGLARAIDGGAATADYQLDLDIRAFELDAETSEAHVEVAAKLITVTSGRIVDVAILAARTPVASTDAGPVAAALDQASAKVMTEIVQFIARRL